MMEQFLGQFEKFNSNNVNYSTQEYTPENEELSTGTTIMALECVDGVVIGADSRTTTGAYIANRVTDKITPISDKIFCCRSGSAADTQAIADIVKFQLSLHSLEANCQPLVKTAARFFQKICYKHRDKISAGIIVAGWDDKYGGQVYSVPIGGMCTRLPFSIGGSGSTYLYGYIDKTYKPNMTLNEGEKFLLDAIVLATERDGSSGGVVRLARITKKGVDKRVVLPNDFPKGNQI